MTKDVIEIKTFVDVQGVWLERKDVTTFERLPYRMPLDATRIDIRRNGELVFSENALYDIGDGAWGTVPAAVSDALDGKVGRALLAEMSDIRFEVTLEEGDQIKIYLGFQKPETAFFDRADFVDALVKAGLEFFQFYHRSYVNADWCRERKQTLGFIERDIEALKVLKAKSDTMSY